MKRAGSFAYQLWAYVVMPEHVDVLVYPGNAPEQMSAFPQAKHCELPAGNSTWCSGRVALHGGRKATALHPASCLNRRSHNGWHQSSAVAVELTSHRAQSGRSRPVKVDRPSPVGYPR